MENNFENYIGRSKFTNAQFPSFDLEELEEQALLRETTGTVQEIEEGMYE